MKVRRQVLWILLALPFYVYAPAVCAQSTSPEVYSDMFSNNNWGNRGGLHLQAARALPPLSLSMTVGQTYGKTSDLLTTGDSDVGSELKLSIVGSPYQGLEIGLDMVSVVNKYSDLTTDSFQLQGNPTILVKFSTPAFDALNVGGVLTVMLPTSSGGNGLDTKSLTLNVTGTASYRVHRLVDLSLNLGYIFDRSEALYANGPDDVQRFAYGINGAENRMNWGVGGVGEFDIADVVGLSPFVEVWGEYASDVQGGDNPVAVSVGLKAFPWASPIVEGIVGADIRLNGAPRVGARTPGLSPWQLFLQLSLHFGEPQRVAELLLCDAAKPCPEGMACEAGGCMRVKEVDVEKVVERTLEKDQEYVRIVGSVVDAESGQALGGAEVSAPGSELPITVNPDTGKFALCPMPADGTAVTLTARALGYNDDEASVALNANATAAPLAFQLESTGKQVTGTLKGSVRDDADGDVIPEAEVFIPAASLKVPVQADGTFEATLKVGRYQVLISAEDYDTQRQELRVGSEEVTTLDVRMKVEDSEKAVRSLKTRKQRRHE